MTANPWRALVVAAHPDDTEFSCAGTLAAWVDGGAHVTIAIMTDGSTGTQDLDLVGPRLARLREAEARAAADIIGAAELIWVGMPDGAIEYTLDLRRTIARLFRRHRPHRFVVMDPAPTVDDRFVNHPDHRAIGQASLDVMLTAGTTPGHFPELLEEGLAPWRGLRELWIAGPARGAVVSDISSTIDRKVAALLCHRSQIGDAEATERWIRKWTADMGKGAGFAHAETFRVIAAGPGFHADAPDDAVPFEPPPIDPRAAPPGG